MTNAKEVRTITGYTHQTQFANADLWLRKAVAFHEAATILYEAGDRLSDSVAIVAFNHALSLELIMKAIIISGGRKPSITHDLNRLCTESEVELDHHQKDTLELLTAITNWRGRYPVPQKEESWDDYLDKVLEKHKTKRVSGNVSTTGVNLKTWPTEANYIKIWEACRAKYVGNAGAHDAPR